MPLQKFTQNASKCLSGLESDAARSVKLSNFGVMRQRLKLAGSALSPEAALRQMRQVQRHRVRIDGAEPIAGISTLHQDQADTLDALKIKKPRLNAQMSLL